MLRVFCFGTECFHCSSTLPLFLNEAKQSKAKQREPKRPDNGAEAMETNPLSDTFSGRTAIGAAPWKRSISCDLIRNTNLGKSSGKFNIHENTAPGHP